MGSSSTSTRLGCRSSVKYGEHDSRVIDLVSVTAPWGESEERPILWRITLMVAENRAHPRKRIPLGLYSKTATRLSSTYIACRSFDRKYGNFQTRRLRFKLLLVIGQEISGSHQRGPKWIKEMPTLGPFRSHKARWFLNGVRP